MANALGLALTPLQAEQLARYLALLLRWNAVYNLTAVRDPAQALTHHLADCLAAWVPVARHLRLGEAGAPPQYSIHDTAADHAPVATGAARPRVLDVGSGGGLPGVVWAVAAGGQVSVTCIDTVGKKAGFIRQAAAELGLTAALHAEHGRVEHFRPAQPFDVITSRAFASLADFTALSAHLLRPGSGVWVALKGTEPTDEQAALPPAVQVFHVEPLHVPGLDASRCLVWMRAAAENCATLRATPPGTPAGRGDA